MISNYDANLISDCIPNNIASFSVKTHRRGWAKPPIAKFRRKNRKKIDCG